MVASDLIQIHPLTIQNFRPYGWLLGKAPPAFSTADTAIHEEHIFHPGVQGESQILWVAYRQSQRVVRSLEVHRLCEQTVIPLTGEIIQIVGTSHTDGTLNTSALRAFRVPQGEGLCMQPGCWHTTRVDSSEVKCVMFTRRSTTADLLSHLKNGSPLQESAIASIKPAFIR